MAALEKNILKYRAMEMLLILFYVEELKELVLDCIQTAKGSKNPVDKALNALVQAGALTLTQNRRSSD